MAWTIGKCSFCGWPRSGYACMFRVRRRAPALLRWLLRRPLMRVWLRQCDDCGPSCAEAEAKRQARRERVERMRALRGAACPDCHTTNGHIDLCAFAGSDGLPVLQVHPSPTDGEGEGVEYPDHPGAPGFDARNAPGPGIKDGRDA